MNRLGELLGGPGAFRVLAIVIAALAIGIGAGFYLSRPNRPQSEKSDSPIEWNQVQHVPKRPPDAEDNQWQERADDLDGTAADRHSGRAQEKQEQP